MNLFLEEKIVHQCMIKLIIHRLYKLKSLPINLIFFLQFDIFYQYFYLKFGDYFKHLCEYIAINKYINNNITLMCYLILIVV